METGMFGEDRPPPGFGLFEARCLDRRARACEGDRRPTQLGPGEFNFEISAPELLESDPVFLLERGDFLQRLVPAPDNFA